jgi:hypothetical protein
MTGDDDDLKLHSISVLGLSETEFEELVDAVGEEDVRKFISILDDFIIRDRIPVVIRRRGDGWLNGRSLLEVFRSEGFDSIYRYIDRLRSWIPE